MTNLRTPLALGLVLIITGCQSNRPVTNDDPIDAYDRQIIELAEEAMQRGDTARAAELYERSLERARLADDATRLITAAERTTRALIASGRSRQVGIILDEAELAAQRLGLRHAGLHLLRAAAELREGRSEQAILTIQPLLTSDIPTDDDQRLDAYVIAGHAELDLGRPAKAELAWHDATAIAALLRQPSGAARTLRLEGRLAYESGDLDRASIAYDLEADRWREARGYLPMAQSLHRAARVYAESVRSDLAADRALRAGMSFMAQRRDAEAAEALHLALATAREAGDATRLRLAGEALIALRDRQDQSPDEESPIAE
ncbi:MAG: hypothetical protein RIG82_02980 [Phycisphaeraceae bacterium]